MASERPLLVVDDDPSILSTVADILASENYLVETARNGLEALQAVEQKQPWLVLLDMRMPVLDGWGFVHALADRGIHVPVVVMTAAQDARAWANEVGAAGYLAKPFDLDDLLDAVDEMLRREKGNGQGA